MMASSKVSPATRIDVAKTVPPNDNTATSVVPPPISIKQTELQRIDMEKKQLLLELKILREEVDPLNIRKLEFVSGEDRMKLFKEILQKEKELIKAQKEKESKNPAILHTTATTGFNTYSFLQFMKNEYEANDFQMIWFNEAVSFISAIESDNRNIINPDPNSSASGFWQMNKDTMKTALTAYARNMQNYDSNWQFP